MHHRQVNPKVSVSIVFVVGMFMSIMDGTIVNVALPSIGHQLGVPSTSIDAGVVAYLLSLAVVIPASGWLGDRWGTKRVFLVALALFTITSALCGLASNFTMRVFFRFLRGAASVWTSLTVLGSTLGGLLLLSAFIVVELRRREALLDLRLLGNRLFRNANLVSLVSSAGFLGVLFVAPLFLQQGLGVTPLTSGLTTFPEALGVVLSSQIVARLYPRVGPRRLIVAGLTEVAIVMGLLSLIGPNTSLWLMRVLIFLTGAGIAFSFVPVQTATFATISSAATGRASALSNAMRQLGSALGVAVLGEVLSAVGPTHLSVTGQVQPNLAAYHAAFLAAAVLMLIAAGIALAVSDRDAAPSMPSQAKWSGNKDTSEQTTSVEAGF